MSRQSFLFHHLGVPSHEPREGEVFLPEFGMHVTPLQGDPFRIQWMRFQEDSTLPEVVTRVPHLAFQVESLEKVLDGRTILIPPNSPSDGVQVAFILHSGVPIEFLEFTGEHPERLPMQGEEPIHG
jgi:hypothetical protein